MIHELKSWPESFVAVQSGVKNFEIRLDDRGYEVGDELVLREYHPDTRSYTGAQVCALVTYLLRAPNFGVPEGYVIMSTRPVR